VVSRFEKVRANLFSKLTTKNKAKTMGRHKKPAIEKAIAKIKIKKSPKYSFVETKSSRGTAYGCCRGDSSPIMLSTDRDTALDHLYALCRGEIQPHDELIPTACSSDIEDTEGEDCTAVIESDSVTAEDVLTSGDDKPADTATGL